MWSSQYKVDDKFDYSQMMKKLRSVAFDKMSYKQWESSVDLHAALIVFSSFERQPCRVRDDRVRSAGDCR